MMNHAFSITNAMKDYERRLRDAQTFVNLLHGRNSGFVQLLQLDVGRGSKTTRSYRGNKVAEYLANPSLDAKFPFDWLDHDDVYISLNVFKTVNSRKDRDLLLFNALYTDLDFYKLDNAPTQAQARAEIDRMITNGEILTPSLIVNSGRGLQLIWLMDVMMNTSGYKKLWRRMQDAIADRFKHLNADTAARSTTQIYRLAGTHSSRTNTAITFEHLADRYSIDELKDFLLPKLDEAQRTTKTAPQRAIKPRKKKAFKTKLTPYTLAMTRKNDMETLVTIRKGDVNRKRLVHLYALVALEVFRGDESRLEEALDDLNDRFIEPLPSYRLNSAKASAHNSYCEKEETGRALYWYTNERIIADLEITSDEQQYMTQLIDSVENQRRNTESHRIKRREAGVKERAEYLADKQTEKEAKLERLRAIIDANPTATNKVIADTLCVSTKTVQRLLKQL